MNAPLLRDLFLLLRGGFLALTEMVQVQQIQAYHNLCIVQLETIIERESIVYYCQHASMHTVQLLPLLIV